MSIKTTATYKSPDSIHNLKIRIKLICQDGLDKEEVKIFTWQKYYSKFEIDFYKDKTNCVSNLEKKYHEDIVNLINKDEMLFSYVHDDHYDLGCDSVKQVHKDESVVENASLNKKEFDYGEYLVGAINNWYLKDTFEVMHLMGDLGEYHENKWLRNEHVLCTVKYNNDRKYFLLYPDFTSDTPYVIKIADRTYMYYIEDASDKMPTDILLQENEILNKITNHRRKLKLSNIGDTVPLTNTENVLSIYLFIEILCGKNFEINNIYVRYYIDLPKGYSTTSEDNGTTFTSYSRNYKHHFGYPFEICVQHNLNSKDQHSCPYIYFEVVSKDFWNCFRMEGLAYTVLPVFTPGNYHYKLQCLRICPDSPLGNLRRYFLGEYPGYSDITWYSIPKDSDKRVINKYGVNTIGTGELDIRINVLHQLQHTNQVKKQFVTEKLKMSTLVKSIEQVLEAFNDAKRKMIEARKNV